MSARAGVALLLSIAVLSVPACKDSLAQAPTPTPKADAPLELDPADLTQVRVSDSGRTLALSGVLAARNQVTLRANASGQLRFLEVNEGDKVQARQLMARIDSEMAKAAMAERHALVDSAAAEQVAAEKQFDSQRQLLGDGFVSQAAYDIAQANLLAKRSAHLAAQARERQAREELSNTEVYAPFSGIVYAKVANVGEYVTAGSPLLTVFDTSVLQLIVSVPATEIADIRVGTPCSLQIVGSQQEVSGRVARIGPAPQNGTRAFPVYVDVDNKTGTLHIGTLARGSLRVMGEHAAATLPLNALRSEGGQDYVLVVQDGKLARRPITVLSRDEVMSVAQIDPSLAKPDLQVVVTRHDGIADGRRVVVAGRAR